MGQFLNNYRTFYPKKCQVLKNMGLGSEIRKKPIPDPGVKKAPDPGSATLVMRSLIAGSLIPDRDPPRAGADDHSV